MKQFNVKYNLKKAIGGRPFGRISLEDRDAVLVSQLEQNKEYIELSKRMFFVACLSLLCSFLSLGAIGIGAYSIYAESSAQKVIKTVGYDERTFEPEFKQSELRFVEVFVAWSQNDLSLGRYILAQDIETISKISLIFDYYHSFGGCLAEGLCDRSVARKLISDADIELIKLSCDFIEEARIFNTGYMVDFFKIHNITCE